jgi:3-ketoacyl-CoA synthase
MGFGPDENLVNGVWLDKSVPKHAAAALGVCLRYLGPRVMTWTQYIEAAIYVVGKQLSNIWTNPFDSIRSYQPKFSETFDHFALHAGGYMVVKALQKALHLSIPQVMPSFASLCHFGNTSCSTTWYVMAYIETIPGGVKRGEKVLQVGLGGGMKAGVNVWRALRNINPVHPAWEKYADKPMAPENLPRPIDKEPELAEKPASNGVMANGAANGFSVDH